MIKKNIKQGFTIIELSLAMLFLAILLITIALITSQIIVIYQKGLAIKAVSSTGRELIDDFSRSIAASPTKSTTTLCSSITDDSVEQRCIKDGGYLFIYQQQTGDVKINGEDKKVPTNGVFCTGRYSYLWNTGYTMNNSLYPEGESLRGEITYQLQGSTEIIGPRSDYRLIKIRDQERTACYSHTDTSSYSVETNSKYDLGTLDYEPEELLTLSEDNLAIFDFKIFPPTQHPLSFHSFYSGTFILATVPGGVDITGSGDYCKDEPDNLNTDFTYCAINKFNFAMRATGETNDEEKIQQKRD